MYGWGDIKERTVFYGDSSTVNRVLSYRAGIDFVKSNSIGTVVINRIPRDSCY